MTVAPRIYAPAKQFTPSVLNSQTDEYARAVRLWNEGKEKLFDFCIEAASVVGLYEEGKTRELAAKIRRSNTTTQNYAKVGHLWAAILKVHPSTAELLRDDLHPSHWLPVARQWHGGLMTLDGAYSWLWLCRQEGWTVEVFRQKLPTIEGRSEMAKTVKQIEFKVGALMADIDNFASSPAFDVDVAAYKEFYEALRVVKEIAPRVMRKEAV
jgi:hypothetical protein